MVAGTGPGALGLRGVLAYDPGRVASPPRPLSSSVKWDNGTHLMGSR